MSVFHRRISDHSIHNADPVVMRVLFDGKYDQKQREMKRLDWAINLIFFAWLLALVAVTIGAGEIARGAMLASLGFMLLAVGLALYNFFRERWR